MLESFQVFILCCVVGMFLAWVMVLKQQIVALMKENQRLKGKLKDKIAAEVSGTSVTKDQPVWAPKL